MKARLLVPALILAAFLSPLSVTPLTDRARAAEAAVPAGPTADLIAVKFHADYCATCKAIDAYYPAVQASLGTSPILFVQLDFSSDHSSAQSRMLAESLGLGTLLEAHSGSGFILLVDASGKVVEKLTKDHDQEAMEATIRASLEES